ncbi:MAG: tetratricopeptide repeat protein [Bacteroidales bacterium]|nr:tetratricopeptide repeat protein [Bacteroidales bacterium]
MSKTKKDKKDDNLEVVEQALTRSERFIEENQKMITIVVIVILVIVGSWLGFKRFIISPREKEAQSQMFAAEQYFEKDSFNLALNGDGNYLGFLDIMQEYKTTKSANLAQYYSGISYLRLGQFKEALTYLRKFRGKDELVGSIALGAQGDANLQLGNRDEAISAYLKAARKSDNSFTTPIYLFKAAGLIEDSGDFTKAIDLYKEIKEKYPNSNEGRMMDKYIARAENKRKKQ